MSSTSEYKRRTMDTFGSGSPEEWSQRIKSLQNQVDEDGLQEQQRLEADIARSRIDRAKRRSTLASPTRIDPASVSNLSKALDNIQRDTDRHGALQRLTGDADAAEREQQPTDVSSLSNKTAQAGAQSVSLAEFMGGRATGPRLNRPAPQADTEEFVQEYEERKRHASSVPLLQRVAKPVALPGLAKEPPKSPEVNEKSSNAFIPVSSASTQPRSAQIKPASSPPTERDVTSRAKMSSSPIPAVSTSPRVSEQAARSSTPVKMSTPVSSPPANSVAARWTAAVNTTPTKSPNTPSSPPSDSQRRSTMLARPISQPTSPPVQQFIPATNPSPAFLKLPPPKEERPSITRLQGRGFVERQVKASVKLSTTVEETSKPVRPSGESKKVLQRWPGEGTSSSTPERRDEVPKREFVRSLPANPPVRAHEPAQPYNAPPSMKSVKERTKEFDKTPVRLPGIGGAGPPGKLARPQIGPQDSPVSNPGVVPRRLPGLAADSAISNALKKPPSTSLLREVTRRRSVHFDDLDKPKDDEEMRAVASGHQTDVADSKKLTHLTRDRVRKPRKDRELANEVNMRTGPEARTAVQDASSIDSPVPPTIDEARASRSTPSTKSSTTTPIVASSDSESSLRKRQPPPLVAPKPMALRRNSQQSPAEQSPAVTSSNEPVAFRAQSVPASDVLASSSPPGRLMSPPGSEKVSVRNAVLSWGQEQQAKPITERSQPEEASQMKDDIQHDSQSTQEERVQDPQPVVPPVLNPPTMPMPQPRPRPLSQSSSERRRSITQRYSSIMLPALKEEKTPVATPEGSLRIAPSGAGNVAPSAQDIHQSLMKTVDAVDIHISEKLQVPDSKEEDADKAGAGGKSPVSPQDNLIHISSDSDTPLPAFSLSRLLAPLPGSAKGSMGDVISIEAFLISGSSSTAIKDTIHVLYDQEISAFVSRRKNRTSGLVVTTVWAWIGSRASCGEKEVGKLQDVASRFNTTLINVPQGKEPFDLVQILGGVIAIRHGSRSHWSKENTALHCVRTHGSGISIEEVELVSRNVCSAYTYCLTILDALIIWHGRGALPVEREAATKYAATLAPEGVVPTEMEEGSDDDMFWIVMDDTGYANADYWKFRAQSQVSAPRLWNVAKDALQPVVPFSAADLQEDAVYMYDGVFELFVIVCEGARGRRQDIRLALAAAERVSAASAVTRTFPPPVHVLILPTRMPLDLRAGFRLMDLRDSDEALDPGHINLLTLAQAQEQLGRRQWSGRKLRDPQFLPLGISPDMVPQAA